MGIFIGHTTALRIFDEIGRGPTRASLSRACDRLPVGRPKKADVDRLIASASEWGADLSRSEGVDLVVPDRSMRGDLAGVNYRVWGGSVPPGAFVQAGKGLAIATPPFAFLQIAAELPRVYSARLSDSYAAEGIEVGRSEITRVSRHLALCELVRIGFGICGTYALFDQSEMPAGDGRREDFRKRSRLCSRKEMLSFVNAASGLYGFELARRALALVADGSASPMETVTRLLFFVPRSSGSYGIDLRGRGTLAHNFKVAKPAFRGTPVGLLPDENCYYIDLAIPEAKLALEYDSNEFHAGVRSLNSDSARRNDLIDDGWTVLTITYDQLSTVARTDRLAEIIARRLGVRQRPLGESFRNLQAGLRSVVLPSVAGGE